MTKPEEPKKKEEEVNVFKKIKDLYDTYKMWITIAAIAGLLYDRTMNFWNIPSRVEADEIRFSTIHSNDSTMFKDHIKAEIEHDKIIERRLLSDSIEIVHLKEHLQSSPKHSLLNRR